VGLTRDGVGGMDHVPPLCAWARTGHLPCCGRESHFPHRSACSIRVHNTTGFRVEFGEYSDGLAAYGQPGVVDLIKEKHLNRR